MTPTVTKKQVDDQLALFHALRGTKAKMLELQMRRESVTRTAAALAREEIDNGFKDDGSSLDWDIQVKHDLYQIDAETAQLLAEAIQDEIQQLDRSIAEFTAISERMASGLVVPMLRPKDTRQN
jgi:hypothetical protein